MNISVLFCASLFCSLALAEATQERKSITNLPANIELYFEQDVSVEVEKFVLDVASKIGFTSPITVVHPSKYAMETNAGYKLMIAIQVPQLILSINQQWFDSLNADEKFFGIALQLMNQLPSAEYTLFKQRAEKIKKIETGISALAEIAVFCGVYYAVRNRDMIVLQETTDETPARFIRVDSWQRKAALSCLAMFAFELAVSPITYFIAKWEANSIKQIINTRFEKWVRLYSSIDAAISYITKSLTELNIETNETLDFLYTLSK